MTGQKHVDVEQGRASELLPLGVRRVHLQLCAHLVWDLGHPPRLEVDHHPRAAGQGMGGQCGGGPWRMVSKWGSMAKRYRAGQHCTFIQCQQMMAARWNVRLRTSRSQSSRHSASCRYVVHSSMASTGTRAHMDSSFTATMQRCATRPVCALRVMSAYSLSSHHS